MDSQYAGRRFAMIYMLRNLLLLSLTLVLTLAPLSGSAKMRVNIASVYAPGAPVHAGLEKFKELVGSRSNGEIEVLLHVSGAMGGERDVFEAMSTGAVEMGAMGSGDVAMFFPRYFAFEVPYVLRDEDHFWKFWNGEIGKGINQMVLDRKGVMTVGIVYRGARYFTANRPVKEPADVKGLKIRLPEIKAWIKIWKQLGALPVVVAFPEVYMALKTGVCEAQENPLESIYAYKFYEAQKYLIATNHVFSTAKYQVSEQWFDTLKRTERKLIVTAWKDAAKYANDMATEADARFLKELQARGMTLVEPDRAAFRNAVQPALEDMKEDLWTPGLYEQIVGIK
jgi:tripartite ATP-independent transporter DctP family solute receptor